MAARRKNLLEAFSRSEAPGAPPPAPPSGGPTLFDVPPSAGRAGLKAGAPLLAVGLVVAFVAGFVTGRSTGGESRAAEPAPQLVPPLPRNQPREFQAPPAAEPVDPTQGASAPAPARLEDSALYDARNVWTVVAIAYNKSTNQDYAWATYEHLHENGLPVFPPVASRNLILVVVGAAPTSDELKRIEGEVQRLKRDGKTPYEQAYRARIDTLIPRTNEKGTNR